MENNTSTSDPVNAHQYWTKDEIAFEAWKHFANIGGADKDRMITISTWLLGFSAGMIAFTLKETVASNTVTEPLVAILLSIVGFIISFISGVITLMYGGYANWNWAKADQIAKDCNWIHLDPKDLPPKMGEASKKFSFTGVGLRLSRPKLPHKKLAPIFCWFFVVSILSFAVHLSIFIWSIKSIN